MVKSVSYFDVESGKAHVVAWIAAGVATLLTCVLSSIQVAFHLRNYHLPRRQRYVIRILWMAPIYALDSFLSLLFIERSIYFDVPRDCYESYVTYFFLSRRKR
eukprot:gene31858-40202_t